MKVRTEARREAILDTASQVFLEAGFERSSMGEIVKRIGGSKSTIYGYFESKEALFLAVAHRAGEQHLASSMAALEAYDGKNLTETLQPFAEKLLEFLCSPEAVAAHRMVIGESGNTSIGDSFYDAGPKRGLTAMSELFKVAVSHGQLSEEVKPWVMAQYFGAMLTSEYQHMWFRHKPAPVSKKQVQQSAKRAVMLFLKAFAPL